MRIADVAEATGVPASTLRVWERRYGLPNPSRSDGGHRVYRPADLAAVRAVVAMVNDGIKVSEAARRLTSPSIQSSAARADQILDALWTALDEFKEHKAKALMREASTVHGVPDVFDLVYVPLLRRLGDEWRMSERHIAREHFASVLLRAHLVELLPTGAGPPTLLAFTPEGETHDQGLLMAVATLGQSGWRAIVLGSDAPLASVEAVARQIEADLIVVSAIDRRWALNFLDRWRPLSRTALLLGGPGFIPSDCERSPSHFHNGSYAELARLVLL